MVINKVLASDVRHLRSLAVLGYKFIEFPRLFGRDKDGVICRLTYEAWMENKICRRFKHHIIYNQKHAEAA
jgi:hypothetical protein